MGGMPKAEAAAEFVRSQIRDAFEQAEDEYRNELAEARRLTATDFEPIRPVFICGNPADVVRGEYLLFVGLNPKADPKDRPNVGHQQALNSGAETNERATLGYFAQTDRPHQYFRHRAKVISAFSKRAALPPEEELASWIAANALFVDSVPYTSACSPRMRSRALQGLSNVRRSRAILEHLLSEHPPAAVLLDGASTHWLLLPEEPEPRVLDATTKGGSCKIQLGRRGPTTVVGCNFIRSKGGPNSNDQLQELGRLIAELVGNSNLR